jgi:hypothetical protein
VGPRLVVVREVSDRDGAEVALAEDEHVIQALPLDAREKRQGSARQK